MLKDDLLRLIDIPLLVPLMGVRHPRGTQMTLELISWDEVDLTVQARVLEVATTSAALADEIALEEADALDEEEQVAEQRNEPDTAEAIQADDVSAADETQATQQSNFTSTTSPTSIPDAGSAANENS